MHPIVTREIIRQRERDLHQDAAKAAAAKVARQAAKARRAQAAAAKARVDDIPAPRVPDYVDGTFRRAGGRVQGGRAHADA